MIVLNQTGTTENVILELLWNVSGQTPIYLFKIKKKDSTLTKTFISTDVSTANCRYQQFYITISQTEDLINGVINITAGEYDYTIYQVATLNLNGTIIKTLQTGILIVKGTVNTVYA